AAPESAGVALGLRHDVLGTGRRLLRLNDADHVMVEPERVVRRAVVRLLLLGAIWVAEGSRTARSKSPAGGVQPRVDAPLPSTPLGLVEGDPSHGGRVSSREGRRERERSHPF